jgi:predicted transcriptional regulator
MRKPQQKHALTNVRTCRTNTISVKTETIYARVTPELARKVHHAAAEAGESDAFILREALREYFSARAISSVPEMKGLADAVVSGATAEAVATPATGAVSYRSKPKAVARKARAPKPDSRKKAL